MSGSTLPCSDCSGTGRFQTYDWEGFVLDDEPCVACDETGHVWVDPIWALRAEAFA